MTAGPRSNSDVFLGFPRTVPTVVTNEERVPRIVDNIDVADWMAGWRRDQREVETGRFIKMMMVVRFPRHLGGCGLPVCLSEV